MIAPWSRLQQSTAVHAQPNKPYYCGALKNRYLSLPDARDQALDKAGDFKKPGILTMPAIELQANRQCFIRRTKGKADSGRSAKLADTVLLANAR